MSSIYFFCLLLLRFLFYFALPGVAPQVIKQEKPAAPAETGGGEDIRNRTSKEIGFTGLLDPFRSSLHRY